MADTPSSPRPGVISVSYWAAARAAAGTPAEQLPVPGPITLAALVELAVAAHPGTPLPDVLAACSVLIGDLPVSSTDPGSVVVRPGDTVEFLPPFAGG